MSSDHRCPNCDERTRDVLARARETSRHIERTLVESEIRAEQYRKVLRRAGLLPPEPRRRRFFF